MTDCRLGYVEYDGFAYCHEHFGWHHYTDRSMWCDAATGQPRPTSHATTDATPPTSSPPQPPPSP